MRRANIAQPTDGFTYPLVTKDFVSLRCLPNTANGQPGETFVAKLSDGTTMYFDWMVAREATALVKTSPIIPKPGDDKPNAGTQITLYRNEF